MKVVSIVGARPQFVKASVVSRAFRGQRHVRETLVHTGQHYDENMSARFFEQLSLPPADHNLGIAEAPHGAMTGRMLEAIEGVLAAEAPDWVVVFGDTNSTLAGALAAAKRGVKVAHVEAGLRSFNRRMPEETNRVLTDHVSDLLFAPTETAVGNLRDEGLDRGGSVRLVGDVMYDAALHYGERARRDTAPILQTHGLAPDGYVLATVHRAENTDDAARLAAIVEGLCAFAERHPIVLPLHPRTGAALRRDGLYERMAGAMQVLSPLGYFEMLVLETNALLIATDSGGVQKEAFYARVPCVTLREETEWLELVDRGWNRVVPPQSGEAVRAGLEAALQSPRPSERGGDFFGGGHAAETIAAQLAAEGSR